MQVSAVWESQVTIIKRRTIATLRPQLLIITWMLAAAAQQRGTSTQ